MVQVAFGLPVFNCIPTIEAICMLVSIHYIWSLSSALLLLLRHYPQSKFTWPHINTLAKHSCSFPHLQVSHPKWNTLVVTWALVIFLKYMHSSCPLMLVRIFQANHSCPCYNYYICAKYQGINVGTGVHRILWTREHVTL